MTGSPGDTVGGAAGVWGEGGTSQGHPIPVRPKARAVLGSSATSRTRFRWGLASARAALCHQSCS